MLINSVHRWRSRVLFALEVLQHIEITAMNSPTNYREILCIAWISLETVVNDAKPIGYLDQCVREWVNVISFLSSLVIGPATWSRHKLAVGSDEQSHMRHAFQISTQSIRSNVPSVHSNGWIEWNAWLLCLITFTSIQNAFYTKHQIGTRHTTYQHTFVLRSVSHPT